MSLKLEYYLNIIVINSNQIFFLIITVIDSIWDVKDEWLLIVISLYKLYLFNKYLPIQAIDVKKYISL